MEVQFSSETSVHIQITWRYIPEDGNIHNYRYVNLNLYNQPQLSNGQIIQYLLRPGLYREQLIQSQARIISSILSI
jgi:hypothetical protein